MLIVICAGLALAYLPLASRPASPIRSFLKTASVVGLALSAAISGAVGLAVALGFCALGDLLLSREGDRAFTGGVAAFAAGHVAYICLLTFHPKSNPVQLFEWPANLGVLLFVLLGLGMTRVLAPRAGALRGAVLLYIPIILGMGLAALTLPQTGPLLLVLGSAIAFITSDVILAAERFLLPADHPMARIAPWLIWPLYWIAQAGFLIALT